MHHKHITNVFQNYHIQLFLIQLPTFNSIIFDPFFKSNFSKSNVNKSNFLSQILKPSDFLIEIFLNPFFSTKLKCHYELFNTLLAVRRSEK